MHPSDNRIAQLILINIKQKIGYIPEKEIFILKIETC